METCQLFMMLPVSPGGVMFISGPFVLSYVTNLVNVIFYKWINKFCCKLALVVRVASTWNDQLCGSGG